MGKHRDSSLQNQAIDFTGFSTHRGSSMHRISPTAIHPVASAGHQLGHSQYLIVSVAEHNSYSKRNDQRAGLSRWISILCRLPPGKSHELL
jgi:hypothetical protein